MAEYFSNREVAEAFIREWYARVQNRPVFFGKVVRDGSEKWSVSYDPRQDPADAVLMDSTAELPQILAGGATPSAAPVKLPVPVVAPEPPPPVMAAASMVPPETVEAVIPPTPAEAAPQPGSYVIPGSGRTRSVMATVMGILAIPLIGLLLYGMYFVFTFKVPKKPPEPKIATFRADGKVKGEETKKPGAPAIKKKPTDEPQMWDVELIWEVENADDVSIDNGIGKVEPKGSKHVEIDKNTTYVMKAKNITGEVTYNLDVEVVPAEKQ